MVIAGLAVNAETGFDARMSISIPVRVRLARTLLRVTSWLPLRVLHAVARGLAILLRWSNTREYRVTRRNIELCFPELDAIAREQRVREAMAHMAMGLSELPRIWGLAGGRALNQIRSVHGAEFLDAAIDQQLGVIIAAPHLGQWELLNLYLCTRGPMALLYRQPQHARWEPLLIGARGSLGAQQIRADAQGVRELYRCLRKKMLLGILPDQRPKGGEGEFAPFFGLPCKSMTLLSRLAHKTGAPVVFGFAERLPAGRGYDLHFLPAPAGIDSDDNVEAVAALHRGLESCVAIAPMQYQWSYKRFALQPDSEAAPMYPDCR